MIQETYFETKEEKRDTIAFLKSFEKKMKDKKMYDRIMLCVIGTQVDCNDDNGGIVLVAN